MQIKRTFWERNIFHVLIFIAIQSFLGTNTLSSWGHNIPIQHSQSFFCYLSPFLRLDATLFRETYRSLYGDSSIEEEGRPAPDAAGEEKKLADVNELIRQNISAITQGEFEIDLWRQLLGSAASGFSARTIAKIMPEVMKRLDDENERIKYYAATVLPSLLIVGAPSPEQLSKFIEKILNEHYEYIYLEDITGDEKEQIESTLAQLGRKSPRVVVPLIVHYIQRKYTFANLGYSMERFDPVKILKVIKGRQALNGLFDIHNEYFAKFNMSDSTTKKVFADSWDKTQAYLIDAIGVLADQEMMVTLLQYWQTLGGLTKKVLLDVLYEKDVPEMVPYSLNEGRAYSQGALKERFGHQYVSFVQAIFDWIPELEGAALGSSTDFIRKLERFEVICMSYSHHAIYVLPFLLTYLDAKKNTRLRESMLFVLSKIASVNLNIKQKIIKIAQDKMSSDGFREYAVIMLAQYKDEESVRVLTEVLGERRRQIFDRFGIWVVDSRVDDKYKFTDDDLSRIEKAFAKIPPAHLGKDIARVVVRTFPHEYVEQFPGWLAETEHGQVLAKKIAQLGSYDKTLRMVRINDASDLETTIAHEVGHGAYYFILADKQREQWDRLHTRSIEKLPPELDRHIPGVNYEDFAYSYGAKNEREDFATWYECCVLDNEKLKSKAVSAILGEKMVILQDVFLMKNRILPRLNRIFKKVKQRTANLKARISTLVSARSPIEQAI